MTSETACVQLQPKQYKSGVKPVWCPGCGDFGVLGSITKALSGSADSALRMLPLFPVLVVLRGCRHT